MNLERKRYLDYLLKNVYRLKKELLEKNDTPVLADYLDRKEKIDLLADLQTTLDFYQSLQGLDREVMTLRFGAGYLIKEIAQNLHYSETVIKIVCRECRGKLNAMLKEKSQAA